MATIALASCRRIQIGTVASSEEFCPLARDGFKIGSIARRMLETAFPIVPGIFDLTVTSVEDLGFHDYARRDAIFASALKLQLGECPEGIGPEIWTQPGDPFLDRCLHIAMKSIEVDGVLHGFGIEYTKGNRKLVGRDGRAHNTFAPTELFAFRSLA